MPVSSIWTEVDCSSNGGAGRWMGYVFSLRHRAELVHGLADDVQDPAERALPHRHRDGPPGVLDLGARG